MNFHAFDILLFLLLLIYLIRNYNQRLLIIFLFIIIIWIFFNLSNYYNYLNYFNFSSWKIMFSLPLLISFLVINLTFKDLRKEILFLFFFVYLGSLIVLYSDNLLIIYLGLEVQTFSLFILIGKNRNSIKGSEASLKYFVLGSLSSGIYLLGLSLLFFYNVELNLINISTLYDYNSYLSYIPIILILLSLFFKLSLFPLHFWIPDIYEGSTWEVIGFLATIPKISIISIVLRLFSFSDFYLVCGIFSIIIGTLGALNQTKLKRFLAYSSISHLGFIILGFGFLSKSGYESSLIYLYIYLIGSLIIFLLVYLTNFSKSSYLIELSNNNINNKIYSLTWIIILLSIGAIPPLSGFISKWFIFNVALNESYILILIISILFSIISVGYYLRIVKILYFQKKSSYIIWNYILLKKNINYNIQSYLLGLGLYFTIFFIFHPLPLFHLINLNLSYLL